MESTIFLIGKRIGGHHLIVTKGRLSSEQLDGMNRQGWILSRIEQEKASFQYDFVRACEQAEIVGW